MGLGPFPEISLAQARKLTIESRTLVAQGIDPKEHREHQRNEERLVSEHTLLNVSKSWFDVKRDSITPGYADDIWRSLDLHVFPSLGNYPITKISAKEVIQMLRPIEAKGSLETVKRLTQRLNEIMTFAVNTGLIFSNPLSGIKDAFKKVHRGFPGKAAMNQK